MNDLIYEPLPKNTHWGTGCLIINDKNEVLLGLRSDNKLWGSPGGTVDENETPIHAIIREVLEECGLTIENPGCIGMVYSYDEYDCVAWNSFVFIANQFTGTVTRQIDEVDEYRWVNLCDLPMYDLFRPFIQSMEVYNENFGPSYAIQKMTSVDQETGIKNPGSNGANGHISGSGKFVYDKKPVKTTPTKTQTTDATVNQIATLKNSYISYYNKVKDIKVMYTVKDGKFVFPDYKTAISKGLVKDEQDYKTLFKEQYVHFALNK